MHLLMAGACLIGGIAVFYLIETEGASLRGTQIPGTEAAREEQRQRAAGGVTAPES
jgi:MHS family proline/betaine transporter-like MFS transporter